MGLGERVTVTQVASRYLVLQLPEDLRTLDWTPDWTPWDRVAATFILPAHDIYGDVSPYMPSTGNLV